MQHGPACEHKAALAAAGGARDPPKCAMPGCSRETWDGNAGSLCCRTCGSSGGASHGPACWEKIRARNERECPRSAYPEYAYPFSFEGKLERRIDLFAKNHRTCDASEVLRIIAPGKDFADCGVHMDPSFFREYYPRPGMRDFFRTYWAGEVAEACNGYPSAKAPGIKLGQDFQVRYGEPLLRGGRPTWDEPQEYHCPYGWRRFSFEVPDFDPSFAVAYHGTSIEAVPQILKSWLRPGRCQEGGDGRCAYLTPSIEYAACPRYAKTFTTGSGDELRYVQVVLQYRVSRPTFIQGETLGPTFHRLCPGGWASRPWGHQEGGKGRPYPKNHKVFDPHFRNEDLEWLFSENHKDLRKCLQPSGIMIRVLRMDPSELLLRRLQGSV